MKWHAGHTESSWMFPASYKRNHQPFISRSLWSCWFKSVSKTFQICFFVPTTYISWHLPTCKVLMHFLFLIFLRRKISCCWIFLNMRGTSRGSTSEMSCQNNHMTHDLQEKSIVDPKVVLFYKQRRNTFWRSFYSLRFFFYKKVSIH